MFGMVILIVFAPAFAKELTQPPPFNMEHGRKEAGGYGGIIKCIRWNIH